MEIQTYLKEILTIATVVIVCGGTPSDFSLNLELVNTNETEIYIGQKLDLRATASFPAMESPNTVIELISSVVPTTMAIESVDTDGITVGSNLAFGNANWKDNLLIDPATDNTHLGIIYNSRVVATMGTVSNSNASADDAESQVVIPFSAVYMSNAELGDNLAAPVSVGIEYLSGTKIIIAQINMNIRDTPLTLDKQPSFSLTNADGTIEVMTPKKVNLKMNLPYPSQTVKVSAALLTDSTVDVDDLSVREISLTSVGDSFSYAVPDATVIAAKADNTCPPPNMVELSTGPHVNGKSQTDAYVTTDSDVEAELEFQVTKPAIVGSNLTVAVAVELNDAEVYVTTTSMVVKAQSSAPTVNAFALNGPANDTTSPGLPASAEIVIDTPPESNLPYSVTLSTGISAGSTAQSNDLSIVSVNPSADGYGVNLPCPIDPNNMTVELTSSGNNGVMDGATVSFSTFNTGSNNSGVNRDKLTLNAMVMPMATAKKGDTFDLNVSVNGLTEQSTKFTVGDPVAYPDSVNYGLSVTEVCSSKIYTVGETFKVEIPVKTERNVTNGDLTIEGPIPHNLTGSPFAFEGASVKSSGANVECVQLGAINANLSDWDDGSNENDRAVMGIPLVCNHESSTDTSQDDFVVELKLKIKDKSELRQESQTTRPVGVGFKYSKTQIWVAIIDITTEPATDFGAVKRVSGFTLMEDIAGGRLPDNTLVQWSNDGEDFHSISLANAVVTPGLSDLKVDLERPVLSRYMRVINTDGACIPNITYAHTDDIPAMYGVGRQGPLMFALDGSTDTCMNLPFANENDTTPFLWVELKKSLFSLADSTAFNVSLIGEGIQCNSTTGPQITYVVFPKVASAKPFKGDKKKCTHTVQSTVEPGKTRCDYTCACSGTDQCATLFLSLTNYGSGGSYTLCEIIVTNA